MAQYKKVALTLTVKESAFSGSTNDKKLFPTRTYEYTEEIDGVDSLKSVQDTICAGMMEQLVVSETACTFYDELTGVRIKKQYTIKARIAGSISAAGVSKEAGNTAIKNGRARAKKLGRHARRKAARKAAAKA